MSDKKISELSLSTTPLAGTEVAPIVQSGVTKKVSIENILTSVQPSGITNGLLFLNGSKVATTSTLLTYDGTNILNQQNNASPIGIQLRNASVSTSAGTRVSFQYGGTTVGYVGNQFDGSGFNTQYMTSRHHIWYNGVTSQMLLLSNGNLSLSAGNLIIGTAGKGIDFSADPSAAGMTSELLDDYEEGTWTPVVTSGSGTITTVAAAGVYTKIGRLVTLDFYVYMTDNGTGATYLNITGAPFASVGNSPLTGYNQSTAAACSGVIASSTITAYKYDATYPIATGQAVNFSLQYYV